MVVRVVWFVVCRFFFGFGHECLGFQGWCDANFVFLVLGCLGGDFLFALLGILGCRFSFGCTGFSFGFMCYSAHLVLGLGSCCLVVLGCFGF